MSPYVPQAGPFAPTMTAEQELDALKKQAEYFQDELGEINKRIEQIEAESKK
jgi:prefoldin subunit 5